jgi:hypothetical protein
MIPSFAGRYDKQPLRVLNYRRVGGVETITPYAIARLLVALNHACYGGRHRNPIPWRISRPIMRPSSSPANRRSTEHAAGRIRNAVRKFSNANWNTTTTSDLSFLQNPRALDADVTWLAEDSGGASRHLKACRSTSPLFRWRANPVRPTYSRTFTPIPNRDLNLLKSSSVYQPLSVPSSRLRKHGANPESFHAMRQARAEGIL